MSAPPFDVLTVVIDAELDTRLWWLPLLPEKAQDQVRSVLRDVACGTRFDDAATRDLLRTELASFLEQGRPSL